MKRAVLIGLGMVADTHVAALGNAKNTKLVGVLGSSHDKTHAFAAKAANTLGHSVLAYKDLESVAQDQCVDFVILATPPNARTHIIDTLVAAKIPILSEKPIERTLNAALKIVETCAQARVPLGVVFQHRAREASLALKRVLDAGDLGKIATVDLRVPWWRDQSYYDAPGRGSYDRDGGGVLINQAIHTLDLALWLLGPVASVQALTCQTPLHRLEAEDWASALFVMQSGAVGTLMASTAAFPGGAESITIYGTRACAHLEAGVLKITHKDGSEKTYGEVGTTGGGADPMAFTHDWHQTLIEDFATSIDERRDPMISGRDALRAHAFITAMEDANRTGHRTEVPNT
ncbi:MAG: Gfo/Idh/MocA family protein [Roseobacter sp.]